MRLRGILLCSCVLLQPAWAAPEQVGRTGAFAALPYWPGIWETPQWAGLGAVQAEAGSDDEVQALQTMLPLLARPPYNAEWDARHEALLRDVAMLSTEAENAKSCNTGGFPMAMNGPQLFQFSITPEETLIVFDSGEVRHVYTDGRGHPVASDLWPTPMGHSIGAWEGDTLVIDTIARAAGPIFAGPTANLGDRAHFVERLRLVDADTLENRMVIDDPDRLASSWELVLRYSRVPELDRMIPWDCEYDRHPVVGGKLTIAPP